MSEKILKVIGFPLPFFISLYTIALMTSMSGMEIFGWGTAVFTLLYILVDKFSGQKKFSTFRLGVEVPLFGLILVVIAGLKVNAPNADFVAAIGSLRWVVLLYLFAYCFELVPSINRSLYILIGLGTLIGGYAIFQHYSGMDLIRPGETRAVHLAPYPGADVYQVSGFLSHHLTYGYSFAQIICFPFAALLLSKRKTSWQRVLYFLSTAIIAVSLAWTYGRGVWIATAMAFMIMTAFVSRRHLITFLLIALFAGSVLYTSNPGLKERFASIWSDTNQSNQDRRDLWKANWLMFTEHPWIGIGWGTNEDRTKEYFSKLEIKNEFSGHAHNNYLQLLSTTGFLGFACYTLFILGFLLITHRLWNDIPNTHYWHRVLALGALGAQISLHTGGLTQWNFGDAEVNHVYIFILAMVAYLSERYSRGIVPDDYAV